jgi:hypothetical protein
MCSNCAACGLAGRRFRFTSGPRTGSNCRRSCKWVKQTYSVRYNLYEGRTGHIWGDRYASEIVAAGPPEWAEEYVFAPVVCPVSRRVRKRRAADRGGGGAKRGPVPDNPARDAEGRPRPGRRAVKSPPRPDLSRRVTRLTVPNNGENGFLSMLKFSAKRGHGRGVLRRLRPWPRIRCFSAAIGEYGGGIECVRRGIRRKSGGQGWLAGQNTRRNVPANQKRIPGSALRTGPPHGVSNPKSLRPAQTFRRRITNMRRRRYLDARRSEVFLFRLCCCGGHRL